VQKIVVVVPTIRQDRMETFRSAWKDLFEKHSAVLVTVHDGENPHAEYFHEGKGAAIFWKEHCQSLTERRDLFCRRTDSVRNMGFLLAAQLQPDVIVTLDDDVTPLLGTDPIQEHLDVLNTWVPVSWVNTAHRQAPALRGMPKFVLDEARVVASHGVWVGVPDFDGETQLALEATPAGVPDTLPYYHGPIPKGVYQPICGMNFAFTREMLPHCYFAPMGPDSGVDGLHRFGDIWMGFFAQRATWAKGRAVYTGASTVLHTRASDARKNCEQEKLGRVWNEWVWKYDGWDSSLPREFNLYMADYESRRTRYADLIRKALGD
jgi:reversibly glycosylated polypeptide/UDP-arabinopyranose mutase